MAALVTSLILFFLIAFEIKSSHCIDNRSDNYPIKEGKWDHKKIYDLNRSWFFMRVAVLRFWEKPPGEPWQQQQQELHIVFYNLYSFFSSYSLANLPFFSLFLSLRLIFSMLLNITIYFYDQSLKLKSRVNQRKGNKKQGKRAKRRWWWWRNCFKFLQSCII